MRKITVTGPGLAEMLAIFRDSIIYGKSSKVEFFEKTTETTFEMIVDTIDATICHLPQSQFRNDPELKKKLIMKGWINKETRTKFDSSVTKNCTVEVHATGEIILKIQ
ncbi:MAG: hypothetical protein WCL02_03110 [bacterium]